MKIKTLISLIVLALNLSSCGGGGGGGGTPDSGGGGSPSSGDGKTLPSGQVKPDAPTSISIIRPSSTTSSFSTPIVQVGGTYNSGVLKVYEDSSCTTQLSSTSTTNSNTNINLSLTTQKTYNLYATNTVGGEESNCSSVTTSYTYDSSVV